IMKHEHKLRNTQSRFGNQCAVNNHIACFTDIPLSLCDKHAANYGKFGIGFKKSSIKRCGGNPVRYFIDYDPVDPIAQEKFDNRGAMYSNLSAHIGFLLRLRTALSDGSVALFDSNGLFSHEALHD